MTIVDLGKNSLDIEKIPIKLLREFEVRTGVFDDLISDPASDSYIKFILEDKATIENAMAKFKKNFLMLSLLITHLGLFLLWKIVKLTSI